MKNNYQKPKAGRKPKNDKANYRYTVNFTEMENAKFMALFRKSEMKVISRFIASMIFGREMKIVKIDKATADYIYAADKFLLAVSGNRRQLQSNGKSHKNQFF